MLILSRSGIFFYLLMAFCVVRPGRAQTPDTSTSQEISRLDREYSNLSIEKGMPAASVAYFADDGIAFAPGAVNGKKYWGSRKDFPGVLIWQPTFVATSRAADLGYTTGPWELKSRTSEASLGFGHYVTLWSKQTDGHWKIAADVGIENPQPTEPPASLRVLPPELAVAEHVTTDSGHNLQKMQRRFSEEARKDIGKAIMDFAGQELRVYRDKSAPAISLVAAQLMLGSEHGKVIRDFGGSRSSKSLDLSYIYGNYSDQRGNTSEHGIYLMIWRVDVSGEWKLVLDLQKKLE